MNILDDFLRHSHYTLLSIRLRFVILFSRRRFCGQLRDFTRRADEANVAAAVATLVVAVGSADRIHSLFFRLGSSFVSLLFD